MKRFDYVKCYYTGGGVYVYSALFNKEVWLYGSLDNYFGSYDLSGETIENFHSNDYDSHWKEPSIPYPTWREIIRSIREAYPNDPEADEMEDQIRMYNPDIDRRCIGDEPEDNSDTPQPDRDSSSETVSLFIEIFEDFLDDKGIDIPNDEKNDDPYASTIYGTDYGILSDKIETLLANLGVFDKEA